MKFAYFLKRFRISVSLAIYLHTKLDYGNCEMKVA